MKYAWIAKHRALWPITLACEVLGVSASGYFEHWRRKDADKPSRPGANKRISDEALLVHIKAIHAEVKEEYGWPKMWKELVARGIRVGKERVRRLMQRHGIKARGKRKFVVTTDSKHDLPIAPNLLQRDFAPEAPNQAWTSDITYIATDEGWLYLTSVIDLFSRQVVVITTQRSQDEVDTDLPVGFAVFDIQTAAVFLRDDLLRTTGQRIWGLTFTLYPTGKFKIDYDYNKPEGYEESDETINLGDALGSLHNLIVGDEPKK